MSDIGHDTIFTGTDGPTASQFLRMVRLDALQQNRPKDDEWIAQWAAAHLDGPALFWYEELSEETQGSWKLLRRELLIRWPPLDAAVISSGASAVGPQPPVVPSKTATIPTPAAAPPSAQAPVVRRSNNERRGRIRVIAQDGEALGYVSRTTDSDNDYCTTQTEGEAVVVSFALSDQPHEMRVSDTEFLGVTFHLGYGPTEIDKHGRIHGGIGLFTHTPGSSRYVSKSKFYNGETRADVWNLLMDGTIIMSCQDSRCRYFLEPCIAKTEGAITITTNHKLHQITAARFVFDPIS